MIVDANVLLYAVDLSAAQHERAAGWLEERFAGSERVGLPWVSLTAFLRIVTHPRVFPRPLGAEDAWRFVTDWLGQDLAWIPQPTARHATVLGELIARHRPTANLIPDAHLAALAIEHGLAIASADSDFARFPEVRWTNPIAGVR